MSYSVSFIGTPEAIKRALDKTSAEMQGQSKAEFDAVKPALEIILDQQVNNGVIQLIANGHASFTVGEGVNPEKTYGTCHVEVKALGDLLVE